MHLNLNYFENLYW